MELVKAGTTFGPDPLARMVLYRYLRFWLAIEYKQILCGREWNSPDTVELMNTVTKRLTNIAIERGLM